MRVASAFILPKLQSHQMRTSRDAADMRAMNCALTVVFEFSNKVLRRLSEIDLLRCADTPMLLDPRRSHDRGTSYATRTEVTLIRRCSTGFVLHIA